MVYRALEVRKKLKEQKIECSVTNIHTINPIDNDLIEDLTMKSKILVTIEEHNIQGGLGTAVSEVNTKLKNSAPQLFIGIPSEYSEAGDYEFLLDKFGLTVDKITKKILDEFSKNFK